VIFDFFDSDGNSRWSYEEAAEFFRFLNEEEEEDDEKVH
jgi:hypothetical protein